LLSFGVSQKQLQSPVLGKRNIANSKTVPQTSIIAGDG
jgi:hypothetical protein